MAISWRRNRAAYLAGSLLVLATAGATVGVSPATAAGSTCGTLGNYFAAGLSPYATSTFGVRADIETNVPALCSASGGSPSSSSAWAMLVPADLAYYAQAGYVKNGTDVTQYTTGFHYLAQYSTPSGGHPTFIGGDPGTSTHTYAVYLRASDDRIHMTRDGNNLLTMNYDTTGNWDPAWGGQFAGETWHTASDVVGTSGDRTRFNYIQRYLANGDINFIATLDGYTSPNTRYHRDIGDAAVGGHYLDIWTDPL